MMKSYNLARISSYLFVFVMAVFTIGLLASSSGKTGKTTLSTSPGCTCHGASSASVTVAITGPSEIETDETARYSVSVSGGPAEAAGVNIAASSGTLTPVSSNLKLSGNELTHNGPASFSGNEALFEFDYTAPAGEGTITIAAAGNSVNSAGGSSGDSWNHAPEKIVTVSAATAIAGDQKLLPDAFSLGQNFPNPFNPETTIDFYVPRQAIVTLNVYNMLGQKVADLVNGTRQSGMHRVSFDGSNLESGTYFYRLTVDGQSASKRMLLLK